MKYQPRFALALFVSAALAGCGSKESTTQEAPAEESQPQVDATAPASAPAALASATSTTKVSVEDIDRWQRGMEAELKAVQDAARNLAAAKDDSAKLEALNASTEMSTIDAGASAAGLDRDQYRRIRNTFSSAVSQLSPIEMEMDVSQMPPQMVEQMKQAREQGVAQLSKELPADVLEALKTRAAELRTQDKTLVGERLKVANAAR